MDKKVLEILTKIPRKKQKRSLSKSHGKIDRHKLIGPRTPYQMGLFWTMTH